MMKKVWLVLLAVVLVFGLAFVGCGGGGNGDGDGDGDEELVPTLVFDMATDSRIQELEVRTIPNSEFAGNGNPITPLQRAGEDNHITVKVVENEGKKAIQWDVKSGTWGVGIDLPYKEFGFREGDEITITGTVVTGSVQVNLNCNVGSQNDIAKATSGTGDFELHVEALTATQADQAKKGSPAGIRLEARVEGVTVQVNNITINGLRPSNVKALAAPIVTATATGVEWEAVTGASGYKVYAGDTLIGTLGASATEFNIYIVDEDILAPGTYEITVVALGVSGSSKDSPASTAVSFTKNPQPVYKFNIKVDGTDQEVTIKGVSGGIELFEDGNGFTFTKGAGYAASYAWFGVDFGTAKLADFEKVTLKYQGVSGDIGYKTISLIASATKFSGNIAPTNTVNAQWWNSYNNAFEDGPQVNGTAESSQQFIIAADKLSDYATDTALNFSIYYPSNSDTKFSMSDIEFVKGTGAVTKTSATLEAIKVKTKPKTEYELSETFDPAGLVVTARYMYGTTGTGYGEDVAYNETDFSFSPNVSSAFATEEELTVTVTYKGKTDTFKILIGEYVPDAFDLAVGMTTGIDVQGSATFADGVISLTTGSSALFTVAATGATAESTIKIKYICKAVEGDPKVILKNGGWSTDLLVANGTEGCNWYPTLETLTETTLTLKGSWYTTPSTGIWFQRNGDTNFFKIKIISVTVE